MPYSPLGRGLLTATLDEAALATSDFRRNDPRFSGPALATNQQRVAALQEIATRESTTPAAVALAWLIAQGPGVVPIPGSRRVQRIRDNARAAELDLSADLLREIEEVAGHGWVGDRSSFAVPRTSRD